MAKELKDFLVGLDNASQVEQVIRENMKNEKCKLFIDDGENNIYIPKSRLDAKISELASANDTIASLNTQVSNLQTQVGKGDDKAQEKIKELQDTIGAYEGQIKNIQIESALQILGIESKARDVKDLKAFVDMSKVSIDKEGNVVGLKEQVETLKKDKAYLFNEVEEEVDDNQNKGFNFFGPGFMGKPDNSNLFGSKSATEGQFGKALFGATHESNEGKEVIDADYFFKK